MTATRAVASAVPPAASWLPVAMTPAQAGDGPTTGPARLAAPAPPGPSGPLPGASLGLGAEWLPTVDMTAWPVATDRDGRPVQTPASPGSIPDQSQLPSTASTYGGQDTLINTYPGQDAHSQDTDTAGWDQYTPSGRTAVRQLFTDRRNGYEVAWYEPGLNYVTPRLARGAAPVLNPASNQVQPLPDMVATGSQGNTAYAPPPPVPVSTREEPGRQRDFQAGWV